MMYILIVVLLVWSSLNEIPVAALVLQTSNCNCTATFTLSM